MLWIKNINRRYKTRKNINKNINIKVERNTVGFSAISIVKPYKIEQNRVRYVYKNHIAYSGKSIDVHSVERYNIKEH